VIVKVKFEKEELGRSIRFKEESCEFDGTWEVEEPKFTRRVLKASMLASNETNSSKWFFVQTSRSSFSKHYGALLGFVKTTKIGIHKVSPLDGS